MDGIRFNLDKFLIPYIKNKYLKNIVMITIISYFLSIFFI